jgi:hypothetical protein
MPHRLRQRAAQAALLRHGVGEKSGARKISKRVVTII